MKLRKALLSLLALFPLTLLGTTIVRVTKPDGSGSWQTGDTVTATTLNGDFDVEPTTPLRRRRPRRLRLYGARQVGPVARGCLRAG